MWNDFVKQEMTCWRDFHNYWIKRARDENLPLYHFRFEDITKDPKQVLMDVFSFSLAKESVQGTLIEAKVDYLMAKKKEGTMTT